MLSNTNYFDSAFHRYTTRGLLPAQAATHVIHAYLDNKPANSKLTRSDRDRLFWHGVWIKIVSVDVYSSECFILALARYFAQDVVSNFPLLQTISANTPDVVRRAVCYSGIVLESESVRWKELESLSEQHHQLHELLKICHILQANHAYNQKLVKECHRKLKRLTPLEILCYASLFAFEYLIPGPLIVSGVTIRTEMAWRAIHNIFHRTLKEASSDSLKMTESRLARSVERHLLAIIAPSNQKSQRAQAHYHAFKQLFFAQLEHDRFLIQSVDAFCFDDSCHFYMNGQDVGLTKCEDEERKWDEANKKFETLGSYWICRGVDAFARSPDLPELAARLLYDENNMEAYAQTMGAIMQTQEIYGLGSTVITDNGLEVDTFQCLLAANLIQSFFKLSFIEPYVTLRMQGYEWNVALRNLLVSGLMDGGQNRLPLISFTMQEKTKNIRSWTGTPEEPQGSLKAAEAILDFWSVDMHKIHRDLNNNDTRKKYPNLYERPFYRFGHYAFQAPWIIVNTTTAAINNLRRRHSDRQTLRSETERIEKNLAQAFRERGFQVLRGFQPPVSDCPNCGEIDLICLLDDQLLVIEVKSTYLRSFVKEIWQYKTRTLRKAGEQARKKCAAVEWLVQNQPSVLKPLEISSGKPLVIHGWVVDTTIELDHELFSGALKVSMDEVVIALRDDADLPTNVSKRIMEGGHEFTQRETLYPEGFSGAAFVDVIAQERIWKRLFQSLQALQ